jgi:alpha-tubulin suppressor-like RCC1 family protein
MLDAYSGRLWTFGDNSEGALGDGTQSQIEDSAHATVLLGPALSPPVRFAFVSAGLYHTLALAGACLWITASWRAILTLVAR